MKLAHVTNAWDDVLAKLRRTSVSWRGKALSDQDHRTYTEAIVLCGIHLMDLLKLDGESRYRTIVSWCHFVARADVYELATLLSEALTVLKHVHSPTSYSWFKRQVPSSAVDIGGLLAPIKPELVRFLHDPTGRNFHLPYQFLSFLTRVSLADLPVDKVPEYKEHEEYLRTLSYDPTTIKDLNAIMREWLKGYELTPDTYEPSFGPGATSELARGVNPLHKYMHLRSDALLRYVFWKHAGIDITTDPMHSMSSDPSTMRTSVFTVVAKSLKDKRIICKEPTGLLWYQQAVRRSVYDFVHKHSVLSRHISFSDQSISGRMAIVASEFGSHATIDLSNASDTVTMPLVKGVFHGTSLYPYLVATRSRSVRLPGGECIDVEKFAPMGSAMCFPVQTLIFSCIVELASRRARAWSFPIRDDWRVFGDDIIVDDAICHDVVMLLESLGFKVNKEKSFTHPSRFREACGSDGFDGIDVTPLRISRGFVAVGKGLGHDPYAVFSRTRDMANECHRLGYRLTRAWVMRVILSRLTIPPLFSWDGRGAFVSDWPDNYSAPISRSERSRDWQERLIVVSTVGNTDVRLKRIGKRKDPPPLEPCPALEYLRYIETLRRLSQRVHDANWEAEYGGIEPDNRVHVYSVPPVARLMTKEVVLPPF